MKNVDIAFEDLPDGSQPPVVHQFMKCHLIFHVKMGSLKRKVRLVAGGHMTDAPDVNTYASVVSRELVRIGLLLAACSIERIINHDGGHPERISEFTLS